MKNQTLRSNSSLRVNAWGALIVAASLGALLLVGTATAYGQDAAQANSPVTADQRTDGQIEMDVVHALDAVQELKQDWITAATVQGEVTLSGTSASEANRKQAESIASSVPGVNKVVNNLKVGDPQNASTPDNGSQPQDQGMDHAQADNQGQTGSANDRSPEGPAPTTDAQMGARPVYRPESGRPTGVQQGRNTVDEPSHGLITLPEGTLLKVRTAEALDNKRAKEGTLIEFTVVRDVYSAGVLAIPRGAAIRGVVIKSKNAGALGGSAELALKLDSLDMEGQSYPLNTDFFEVRGPSKTGHTVNSAIGGALFGALIGGAMGGGSGAAIGAAAGGVGGTAVSAATPGPRVWIPTEALMNFHLGTPLTITPVSQAEALRLSSNEAPPPGQRPTLYRRGPRPYGYPQPPPPGYEPRPY